MGDELGRIRLFSALDDAERAQIAPFLQRRAVLSGETIIREERPEGCCFFLASGSVRVSSSMHRMEQEEVYSFLRSGDHFGEISMIDGRPPAASVIAEEPGVLYSISHEDLQRLMEEHPGLANKLLWAMLGSFCQRLRETNQSLSFARFLMKRPGESR